MFFIIILLRSWQLYTEGAIWTLGRHLVQNSSSVTQKQCLCLQSMLFCPQFNKTAKSGPKRGCLQLHPTAAREHCSNRLKSRKLFQTASEAAKTCCSLNKLQQNFKVREQNCLLGSSTQRDKRKSEREGTVNWLISSLWSFWLHLNTLPGLLATFSRNSFK